MSLLPSSESSSSVVSFSPSTLNGYLRLESPPISSSSSSSSASSDPSSNDANDALSSDASSSSSSLSDVSLKRRKGKKYYFELHRSFLFYCSSPKEMDHPKGCIELFDTIISDMDGGDGMKNIIKIYHPKRKYVYYLHTNGIEEKKIWRENLVNAALATKAAYSYLMNGGGGSGTPMLGLSRSNSFSASYNMNGKENNIPSPTASTSSSSSSILPTLSSTTPITNNISPASTLPSSSSSSRLPSTRSLPTDKDDVAALFQSKKEINDFLYSQLLEERGKAKKLAVETKKIMENLSSIKGKKKSMAVELLSIKDKNNLIEKEVEQYQRDIERIRRTIGREERKMKEILLFSIKQLISLFYCNVEILQQGKYREKVEELQEKHFGNQMNINNTNGNDNIPQVNSDSNPTPSSPSRHSPRLLTSSTFAFPSSPSLSSISPQEENTFLLTLTNQELNGIYREIEEFRREREGEREKGKGEEKKKKEKKSDKGGNPFDEDTKESEEDQKEVEVKKNDKKEDHEDDDDNDYDPTLPSSLLLTTLLSSLSKNVSLRVECNAFAHQLDDLTREKVVRKEKMLELKDIVEKEREMNRQRQIQQGQNGGGRGGQGGGSGGRR